MNSESFLDTEYHLNPRLRHSIKSANSVAVYGSKTPLELPLDVFQVLMMFFEKATARQVFESLDVDVNIEEFASIIFNLVERGVLKREPPVDDELGLQKFLNPAIFSEHRLVNRVGRWLRQGRAVCIPDALPLDLAERAYDDLDRSRYWSIVEGGHDFFHYRTCTIETIDDKSPALSECSRLFASAATRRFIGELCGQDCAGEPAVGASWYRPGEYALPHDDSVGNSRRSVAYIWYLTKHWRQEWGGALFWCPTGQYLKPQFNVLTMFRVLPSNIHLVCPVATAATAKRLTINGFWLSIEQERTLLPVSPDALVSPRVHCQPCYDDPAQTPVIVL